MGISEKKGYDRENLKQLYEKYDVPFVPDYTGLQSRKIGLIMLIVLEVISAVLLVSVFPMLGLAVKPSSHSMPTPTIPLPPPLTCPGMRNSVTLGSPQLDFCSPVYLGIVGGPVGSRIVLVGTNFPTRQNVAWFVITNQSSTSTTPPTCPSPDCHSLLNPDRHRYVSPQATLYSWPWLPPFPKVKGNYSIMAQFNGTENSSVTSFRAFTVTSSSLPCISVAVDENPKSDCTRQQTVALHSGDRLEIDGSHWNLDWGSNLTQGNEQVIVSAKCIQSQICVPPTLFTPTGYPVGPDGSFTVTITITARFGNYQLIASNKISQPIAIPGGNANTVADDALTFGTGGSASILILSVT